MMNLLRDGNLNNDEYLKICKKTIDDNDIRFRIKNKINNIPQSLIKEQKGYNITRILLDMRAGKLNLNNFPRKSQKNTYSFQIPLAWP